MHRIVIPLAVLIMWLPAPAAEKIHHSGQNCQNEVATDADEMQNDAEGTGNQSTSSDLIVFCPVMGWQDDNNSIGVDEVRVLYFDQNDHNVHGGIGCVPFYTNATGTSWVADTRHSCASSSTEGCASADPDHTGRGTLAWDDGSPETLDNLSDLKTRRSDIKVIGVHCTLPRDDSGEDPAEVSYVLHHGWTTDPA